MNWHTKLAPKNRGTCNRNTSATLQAIARTKGNHTQLSSRSFCRAGFLCPWFRHDRRARLRVANNRVLRFLEHGPNAHFRASSVVLRRSFRRRFVQRRPRIHSVYVPLALQATNWTASNVPSFECGWLASRLIPQSHDHIVHAFFRLIFQPERHAFLVQIHSAHMRVAVFVLHRALFDSDLRILLFERWQAL